MRRHPRHKDILPAQPVRTAEPAYTPPPGLSEAQKKIVADCAKFLDEDKLSFLRARLLGGVRGWHDISDDETKKVRAVAARYGQPLE